eukprot:IDg13547t1
MSRMTGQSIVKMYPFLNELARDVPPWDVPVKPGAGAEIQPHLPYHTLNIPVAASNQPVDASDRSPVLAAEVVPDDGVSSTGLVVALFSTTVASQKPSNRETPCCLVFPTRH